MFKDNLTMQAVKSKLWKLWRTSNFVSSTITKIEEKTQRDLQIKRDLRNHKPIAMCETCLDPESKSKSLNLTEVQSLLSDGDIQDTYSEWQPDHTVCLSEVWPHGKLRIQSPLALENTLWSINVADSDPGGVLSKQYSFQRRWGFDWLEGVIADEQLVKYKSPLYCFLASGPFPSPTVSVCWGGALMLVTALVCATPHASHWPREGCQPSLPPSAQTSFSGNSNLIFQGTWLLLATSCIKNKKMLSSVAPMFSTLWSPFLLLEHLTNDCQFSFIWNEEMELKLSLRFLLALKFHDATIFHHSFALILSLSEAVTYFVQYSIVRVIAYLHNLSIIFIIGVILKIQCKMYKYLIRRL